jgi:hypothetical protein
MNNAWVIVSASAAFGSFLLSLTVLLLGRYVANKLMHNDLAHLSADVKEVKDLVKLVIDRQDNHAERISTLEGQLRAR